MVELWMSEVAENMKDALVGYISLALDEWTWRPDLDYLEKYPGQCIFCAFAISWTRAVEQHIKLDKDWTVYNLILLQVKSQLLQTFNLLRNLK